MELSSFVRDVPDFPQPGILFKDISPLLADSNAFAAAIDHMAAPFKGAAIDIVAGIDARGFLFGPPIAQQLGVGFAPIRKPGKLPAEVHGVDYSLEYGTDRLEIHRDSFAAGERVLLVDDVLATGGTLAAACQLIQGAGGTVAGISVLIDLVALGGTDKLPDVPGMVVHRAIEVN